MELIFEELDCEETPLGRLTLHRYTAPDGAQGCEVRLDGAFLMASHGAQGERHMPRLAWERLGEPRVGLRALVGGLGAGHTLRAALDLPGIATVTVVEIGARVFDWNRAHFAEANGRALDDPRVETRVGDLAALLRAGRARWDMLLLDVDNGPGWLAAPGNAWLYEPEGLGACRRALRRGGVLAVWSPAPNPRFLASLREVFPGGEELRTGAFNPAGERGEDAVYLGSRGSPRRSGGARR